MSGMATTTNSVATQPHHDLADVLIALFSGLMLAMTTLSLCTVPLAGKMAGSRDFVAYYATGRQLVQHADPYDAGAIRAIERSSGLSVDGVLLMRNPPWGLPIALPLGFFGVRVAAALWSLILIGCLLIPVRLIRRMHGSPPNHLHWLGLSFTPALMCLTMGQTSLFALLGFTLFLYYHRTHPFGAGAALWFCSLKPHLILPFAAVLLAWIVFSRSYKLLAGSIVAMAASWGITYLIDPTAFSQYMVLMRSPSVIEEFVPCLSDAMRFAIRPQAVWLQYLPAALASLWALYYFWRRRQQWDWLENGSLLVLVSLVAAPYSFVYDQSLAVPAILHGMYKTRNRALLVILVCPLLLIGLQATRVRISSAWYLWTSPVWLIWYLIACRKPADATFSLPEGSTLAATIPSQSAQ
jgi:hypothetical protein